MQMVVNEPSTCPVGSLQGYRGRTIDPLPSGRIVQYNELRSLGWDVPAVRSHKTNAGATVAAKDFWSMVSVSSMACAMTECLPLHKHAHDDNIPRHALHHCNRQTLPIFLEKVTYEPDVPQNVGMTHLAL